MHEKPKTVDETFAEKYGDGAGLERVERMQKRNEIAKELVTTTFKGMAAELKERAEETHERELKEWGLELEGIGEAEDVDEYVSSSVRRSSPTYAVL